MDRSSVVYLDHNVLSSAAATKTESSTLEVRDGISRLLASGHQIALSGWHVVELARSRHQAFIESYCLYVESLSTVWLSSPLFVKREEIKRYLHSKSPLGTQVCEPISAVNPLLSQMWTTYGGVVVVGETFSDTIRAIKPGYLEDLEKAISKTPAAILTARAALQDGRHHATEHLVDRSYFASLLSAPTEPALNILLGNKPEVLSRCPTVAIEDALTRIRVSENFKPEPSDAADLQHALVALAYCGHIVSDDKQLRRHADHAVGKLGLSCQVHRRPGDVLI